MKRHILTIVIIGILLPIYAQVATPPSAGDGTESNPYQIANLENLYWISADTLNFDKHYIQTADIDASETTTWIDTFYTWTEVVGWLPIGIYERQMNFGDCDYSFNGSYDGQNFTIDSLYIRANSSYTSCYLGLFGIATNASLSNINLSYVNFISGSYTWEVGGLVGFCIDTYISNCNTNINIEGGYDNTHVGGLIGGSWGNNIIENCFTEGVIESPSGQFLGGLVGVFEGSINKCSSSISISGGSELGGLVGYYAGNITSSYSTGTIIGSGAGGLVGSNAIGSNIRNCFSSGVINGKDSGGLIGANQGNIYNSFCYGKVEGISSGGLVGKLSADTLLTITNSFWDIETSGIDSSAAGIGLTTVEMKTLSTFTDAGWDFAGESVNGTEDIWDINGVTNNGYPFLAWMGDSSINNEQLIINNYSLEQNYPNPFNPTTTIRFSIPAIQDVKLSVYNSNGQLVKTLINEKLSQGHHSALFDAKNLNSGIYFYTLQTSEKKLTNKMLLIK